MTTRWRPEFDPNDLYFVTTTTAQRAHVFRRGVVKRIVADGLYYVSLMNQVSLYAFVIMPNYVHAVVQCPEGCALKEWARAFKGGVSRLIVRHYQGEGNQRALEALQAMVVRLDRQSYKVWEDGYFAKQVFAPDFLAEKLSYIHNNPVQAHWQLVDAAERYLWSSARYYMLDEPALIPLRDARELLG